MQTEQLIQIIDQSRKISLSKVKISISISRLIKLKLGDTFRFYLNHIIRHLKQIERIEEEMKQSMTG